MSFGKFLHSAIKWGPSAALAAAVALPAVVGLFGGAGAGAAGAGAAAAGGPIGATGSMGAGGIIRGVAPIGARAAPAAAAGGSAMSSVLKDPMLQELVLNKLTQQEQQMQGAGIGYADPSSLFSPYSPPPVSMAGLFGGGQ